jgi:signal transduction histidine kinase
VESRVRDSSLWSRWGQALLIPIVVFIAITGILTLVTRELIDMQGQLRHTQDVKDQLASIYSTMQEAESGTRGFILSGDERYLASYETAKNEIPERLETLKNLTSDNPVQQENFAKLRTDVEQRLTQFTGAINSKRNGNIDGLINGMRQGTGLVTMTSVRDMISTMNAEEDRLTVPRRQSVGRAATYLQLFAYALMFFIMTAAIVGLVIARRRRDELQLAQDTLRVTNNRLTTEIAERSKVEDQLRQVQKMEAIGQLTGGIAHDFNNMLAVIMGALNILQRRIERGDYNVGSFVQAAIEGAQRGGALTQRLLAFARKQMLEPRPVDANKLVSGMSDLLRRTLGETIQTEVILAGGLWRTFADAHQLETTILNLVVNARDAMPEGGRLTIETANAHLDESYASEHKDVPPGQYVMVGVTDTGTGMSPEVLSKAFDPFFTTKGAGRGTGLGLSQVYGFVKQSGGHVKIYSEPSHGATIKVYLPRYHGADEATAKGQSLPVELPRAKTGEKILVVEDEEAVRKLAVDGLQEMGYTVIAADGAAEALAQIDKHPDIIMVFTDIVMPNKNGRELVDEALKRKPSLKVLYTTGYTRNAVVHNGTLDPGVRLLGKPYTLAQLAKTVREILDG